MDFIDNFIKTAYRNPKASIQELVLLCTENGLQAKIYNDLIKDKIESWRYYSGNINFPVNVDTKVPLADQYAANQNIPYYTEYDGARNRLIAYIANNVTHNASRTVKYYSLRMLAKEYERLSNTTELPFARVLKFKDKVREVPNLVQADFTYLRNLSYLCNIERKFCFFIPSDENKIFENCPIGFKSKDLSTDANRYIYRMYCLHMVKSLSPLKIMWELL
ncbi:hypothetical protein KNT64_gp016 [Pseudomonas phage PspYZU05]|uniref:Uncharacterized protein n=1 Tax=Pseudomonas phage PspYZU05 TaxID=1983556 RepID=A0A2U7NLR4_9CAUD|nr:hypothetical protein KNT64_gp016 [Pseudomonas phage PspYZU05]ASD51968.1 hypothetical protein PspYZU05_16 [Pseudomonas phage PspYZU05]